jgi:proteasome activator subunit 4
MYTNFPQTYLTMIPVMTSFFPQTHIQLYLPTIFKIWEAFNSTLLDDRLIEFVGELSEEHVAGTMGKAGEDGGAPWKDVGIWSETEWTLLMGKALGSMSTLDKRFSPQQC